MSSKGFKKIPIQAVLVAIDGTMGRLTNIATRLDCSVWLVKEYINKVPEIREAYEFECTRVGDYVEGALMGLIKKGNCAATIFYCKTKLRERGYIEKHQEKPTDEDQARKAAELRRWYRAIEDSVPKPPEEENGNGEGS